MVIMQTKHTNDAENAHVPRQVFNLGSGISHAMLGRRLVPLWQGKHLCAERRGTPTEGMARANHCGRAHRRERPADQRCIFFGATSLSISFARRYCWIRILTLTKKVPLIRNTLLALVLSLPLAACGDDGGGGGGGDCATSELTYANFGETFMTTYCVACHDSAKSGGERLGAPAGADYDDSALIQSMASLINSRAGQGSTMPPTAPRPVAEERADLKEWLECGAN